MPSHRRDPEKQLRLTVFNNEPVARLAEQRLQQEGIPCFIQALQGGPGLWGSAYNLPHALYVYESHEMQAREILDLTPMEMIERDAEARALSSHRNKLPMIIVVITILLVLVIAGPSFSRLFG